ncbi:MAG: DUF4743 domain-containing protein [Chromatiales bacterium]
MSFIDRIQECNNFQADGFIPFYLDNLCIGLVEPGFAAILADFPAVFLQQKSSGIGIQPHLDNFERRTQAMAEVANGLLERGTVGYLLGEPYAISDRPEQPLFLLDRALVSYFGFRSYGQHLNGYVRQNGELMIWVAKRAADRRIFPGLLDNLVAGGLPYGISLQQNLAKECYEEAGIPAELAALAQPVGALTYNAVSYKGYKPDTLYCYDLQLPADFQPVCTDGEVESFELCPANQVIEIVRNGTSFKPNCNLVLIDFFIRHGLIAPEHPDYLAIQTGLKVPFTYTNLPHGKAAE